MNNTKKNKIQNLYFIQNIMKMKEFGIFMVLVVLCLAMTFASPYFLKTSNIFNILRQFSIYAILAIGQAMIIIIGGLDLSVGTVMGASGVMCAFLATTMGIPSVIVFPLVLIFGSLFGLANGLLITKVGVNPFITTLGMQYIARAVSLLITGGIPIWLETKLAYIGGGYIGPVPVPVVVMVIIAIIGIVYTIKTVSGRNLYAVGSNEKAAKLSGIRVDKVKIQAYTFMGTLAGLSGIILTGTLKTAEPTAGLGYEMQAIVAVIIGGVSLSGGVGTILGVVIGAALMGVLRNSFVLLHLSSYWQILSLGIIIILAVSLDSIKSKRRNI